MASSNTSALSTPVFNGENYQVWAVKMKAYLRGLGLWQWVETERQIQPLGNNPTLIKSGLMKKKKLKLQELYLTSMLLSQNQFSQGLWLAKHQKRRGKSLRRYKLMEVVKKIRLLGEDLTDQRVVEKVLVSLPKRFESKISSLEDSKDLTKISLAELVHAFQAQE
ncbi:hypothetical protein CK203_014416 [Vitis vinifera]|uniref:DUF4219 domain-containing protein n=1 Tax=Vitis vinifera TaxID=29760 RepID=A0A438K5A9_VITVI|nr:hypothetical protein CK203_014416 [Vitis vinifera]